MGTCVVWSTAGKYTLLFIIFINDIDYAVPLISAVKKFADDTKTAQKIQDQHDQTVMQQHLNNLFVVSRIGDTV